MRWKVGENVRVSVKWAVSLAAVYSAYVVILAIAKGSLAFDRYNTTLLEVLGVYWLGGMVAAVLVGILLPIGRHPLGASVLGALGGVPLGFAATLAIATSERWGENLVVGSLGGALVGALTGLMFWVQDQDRGR